MPKIPKDVVILPKDGGRWVAMNVFTRTCIGTESPALDVLCVVLKLQRIAGGSDKVYPQCVRLGLCAA